MKVIKSDQLVKDTLKIMNAIVTHEYGSVEVLNVQDVERPKITDDEILIRVHACSVNPVDWKIRRGDVKVLTGRKPPSILGGDYAGIVAEVGSQITGYKTGDAVWGMVNAFKGGTYAEFLKVNNGEIGLKPENLSFEEAASLPLVGLTAYQALVYQGRLRKGCHVMINGCSGGVGLAGLQIARALECRVTGVCSTKNLELAKNMGADRVIDYTRENIHKEKNAYDIFFDAVGNQSFLNVRAALTSGGTYVSTLPTFQTLILGPMMNIISTKKMKKVLVKPNAKDLAILREMAENGRLVAVIEKIYPLDRVREAHQRSETGRVVGKIVLKVAFR